MQFIKSKSTLASLLVVLLLGLHANAQGPELDPVTDDNAAELMNNVKEVLPPGDEMLRQEQINTIHAQIEAQQETDAARAVATETPPVCRIDGDGEQPPAITEFLQREREAQQAGLQEMIRRNQPQGPAVGPDNSSPDEQNLRQQLFELQIRHN
jgi:hypothetical protein